MNKITQNIRVSGGRLDPSDLQKSAVQSFVRKFEGKTVAVTFAKPTVSRTQNQNAFYWGVILTELAAHTGHTTEDLHCVVKDLFLPRKFINIGQKEIEIRKTTTDLTPEEFNQYLTRICAWASQELGLSLTEPNQR